MVREVELVPGVWAGDGHPTVVVAEIGQNHQGEVAIAKQLIDVAKDAGASFVKFQKKTLEENWTKVALAKAYVGPQSWGPTYRQHKEHLEFTGEAMKEIQDYANEKGIPFMCTPFDCVAADYLHSIDTPVYKIASMDPNNFPLLEKVASFGKPMIVSTGMCDMEHVEKMHSFLKEKKATFCILQCCSAYPQPPEATNLRVIQTYKDAFPDIPIGYSGHEIGSAASLGAVALGAQIVERHITLDHSLRGSDHKASMDPVQLKQLIEDIRTMEKCIGDGVKRRHAAEIPVLGKLGKCLVARTDLSKGHVLRAEDIAAKTAHPRGLELGELPTLIGKTLLMDVEEDTAITEAHI